ncbi:Vesicle transport through interaction with t-SNAREs -like protein 1B [Halotydeus destructor]|nr:Vesicle transport through interaction with t-SNAREs -like protein 1B [Halotydeus destructor]
MASSARYEDLHDDLELLKDKVKLRISQDITEGTLNGLLGEGDKIVSQMKREADMSPLHARNEMQTRWSLVNGEWASFRRTCRSSLNSKLTRPTVSPLSGNLIQGTSIMERTGQSIFRATQVAQESEHIGTEVISELGVQREALTRTRDRITDANQDLKRTSVLIRSINRRVLTNKCMLIVIIALELGILGGQLFLKFGKH